MIDKDIFIQVLLKKAKVLPVGHHLDIRPYKRNRSVLLIKETEDSFKIVENGFYKNEFETNLKGLKKILKKILKLEFPRSHKIRVYNMGKYINFVLLLFVMLFTIFSSNLFAESFSECLKKADAINEFIHKTYKVNPDGSYTMKLKMQVYIKTYKGKKDWADYRIPYNSAYQKIRVDKAETILPSGKVISATKKEIQDILDPSTSQSSIYSKARLKIINFPAVDVGTKIRFQITLKSKWGFWARESFRLTNPTIVKKVELMIPKDMKILIRLKDKKVRSNVFKKQGFLIYTWTGEKLPSIHKEPYAPQIENQPFCLLVSSFDSLEKTASFFCKRVYAVKNYKLNLPEWAKKKNPDLLYKELISRVSIYYIGLFDTDLKPQSFSVTLRKLYGSPLDLAFLFAQILKEQGINAHFVLVNTTGIFLDKLDRIIYPELFDQVLVYAKGHFYSFTDKDAPAGIICDSDTIGLDLDLKKLITIHDVLPNVTNTLLSIRAYPHGYGIGWLKKEFLGKATIDIRKKLRYAKGEEFRIKISELFHQVDPVLKPYNEKPFIKGVNELAQKVEFNFKFRLDPVFMESDSADLFLLPESELIKYYNCLVKRHYGLAVVETKTERLVLRLSLPKGLKPIFVPSSEEGKIGLLKWNIKTSWKKHTLIFIREITLNRGILGPKESSLMLKKIKQIADPKHRVLLFQNTAPLSCTCINLKKATKEWNKRWNEWQIGKGNIYLTI